MEDSVAMATTINFHPRAFSVILSTEIRPIRRYADTRCISKVRPRFGNMDIISARNLLYARTSAKGRNHAQSKANQPAGVPSHRYLRVIDVNYGRRRSDSRTLNKTHKECDSKEKNPGGCQVFLIYLFLGNKFIQ